MRARQSTLFPYANPLLSRLGPDFFRNLPRSPGVYLMRGARGEILYVGKAKDLRARLASYRAARPGTASRKVLRMIQLAHAVEIRPCASETAAFLAENALLRGERPLFNVVNTRPDTYFFILVGPGAPPGLPAGALLPAEPAAASAECDGERRWTRFRLT